MVRKKRYREKKSCKDKTADDHKDRRETLAIGKQEPRQAEEGLQNQKKLQEKRNKTLLQSPSPDKNIFLLDITGIKSAIS